MGPSQRGRSAYPHQTVTVVRACVSACVRRCAHEHAHVRPHQIATAVVSVRSKSSCRQGSSRSRAGRGRASSATKIRRQETGRPWPLLHLPCQAPMQARMCACTQQCMHMRTNTALGTRGSRRRMRHIPSSSSTRQTVARRANTHQIVGRMARNMVRPPPRCLSASSATLPWLLQRLQQHRNMVRPTLRCLSASSATLPWLLQRHHQSGRASMHAAHAHACTPARPHACTPARTHSRLPARTPARTHAHTHARTHASRSEDELPPGWVKVPSQSRPGQSLFFPQTLEHAEANPEGHVPNLKVLNAASSRR